MFTMSENNNLLWWARGPPVFVGPYPLHTLATVRGSQAPVSRPRYCSYSSMCTSYLFEWRPFITRPFYQQKNKARHPLNGRRGGNHSRSEHFGEKEHIPPSPRLERFHVQSVTKSLYWLSYLDSPPVSITLYNQRPAQTFGVPGGWGSQNL